VKWQVVNWQKQSNIANSIPLVLLPLCHIANLPARRTSGAAKFCAHNITGVKKW